MDDQPYQRFFLSSRPINVGVESNTSHILLNINNKLSITLPNVESNATLSPFSQVSNGYQDIQTSAEGFSDDYHSWKMKSIRRMYFKMITFVIFNTLAIVFVSFYIDLDKEQLEIGDCGKNVYFKDVLKKLQKLFNPVSCHICSKVLTWLLQRAILCGISYQSLLLSCCSQSLHP